MLLRRSLRVLQSFSLVLGAVMWLSLIKSTSTQSRDCCGSGSHSSNNDKTEGCLQILHTALATGGLVLQA
jgi:hypothetical protein